MDNFPDSNGIFSGHGFQIIFRSSECALAAGKPFPGVCQTISRIQMDNFRIQMGYFPEIKWTISRFKWFEGALAAGIQFSGAPSDHFPGSNGPFPGIKWTICSGFKWTISGSNGPFSGSNGLRAVSDHFPAL